MIAVNQRKFFLEESPKHTSYKAYKRKGYSLELVAAHSHCYHYLCVKSITTKIKHMYNIEFLLVVLIFDLSEPAKQKLC